MLQHCKTCTCACIPKAIRWWSLVFIAFEIISQTLVSSADAHADVTPSYCIDDPAWSIEHAGQNITCESYLPVANSSAHLYRRSCYDDDAFYLFLQKQKIDKDHMEHPDMVLNAATQLYYNTRGLEDCNRCCRTCYDEWREGEERVKELVRRSVNPIPNPDPNPKQAPQMSLKEA